MEERDGGEGERRRRRRKRRRKGMRTAMEEEEEMGGEVERGQGAWRRRDNEVCFHAIMTPYSPSPYYFTVHSLALFLPLVVLIKEDPC